MMKRKMLGALALFLTLTVVPVFANGNSETADAGVRELKVFHFKSLWMDSWNELMQEYQKETGIAVDSEITGGSSDYTTMLKTKLAANQMPDIFFIQGYSDYRLFKEYIEPQNGAAWTNHLAPFAKQGYMVDGNVIGMPMTMEAFGLLYNKDLFAKAGISAPPQTFGELSDAVGKLKAAGIVPFATGFGTDWVIGQHFANVPFSKRSDVQGFVSDLNDGTATITDDPVMNQWKSVFDLILANCEPNPLTTDHQSEVTLFAQGKAAMMLQGNWKEGSVLSIAPDMHMGILPIPLSDSDAKAGNITAGIPFYISINAKSSPEVRAAAEDFLTWLVTSDIGKQYLVEKFQAIPTYTDIPTDDLSPLGKEIVAYSNADKVSMWSFPLWPDGMTADFTKAAQAYVGKQISFDAMLENMQASWEERLR
jgi:raffinose/stachyose/melibiose transport system substrate-binding protein